MEHDARRPHQEQPERAPDMSGASSVVPDPVLDDGKAVWGVFDLLDIQVGTSLESEQAEPVAPAGDSINELVRTPDATQPFQEHVLVDVAELEELRLAKQRLDRQRVRRTAEQGRWRAKH